MEPLLEQVGLMQQLAVGQKGLSLVGVAGRTRTGWRAETRAATAPGGRLAQYGSAAERGRRPA